MIRTTRALDLFRFLAQTDACRSTIDGPYSLVSARGRIRFVGDGWYDWTAGGVSGADVVGAGLPPELLPETTP